MSSFERLGSPVVVGVALNGLGRCEEADGNAAGSAHYGQASPWGDGSASGA